MDEIKRALLGDKEAQRRLTERYEVLPCPHCNAKAEEMEIGVLWRDGEMIGQIKELNIGVSRPQKFQEKTQTSLDALKVFENVNFNFDINISN